MKKKIILTVGLVILGLYLALSYIRGVDNEVNRGARFEKDLSRAIDEQKRAMRAPSGEIFIRLKDITRFKWDRFYILGEDAESESIAREFGIRVPATAKPILLFVEHFDFLVFIEVRGNGKIIHDLRCYRERCSFEKLKKSVGWSPDEAVFRYVESPPRHCPAGFLEEIKESVPVMPETH